MVFKSNITAPALWGTRAALFIKMHSRWSIHRWACSAFLFLIDGDRLLENRLPSIHRHSGAGTVAYLRPNGAFFSGWYFSRSRLVFNDPLLFKERNTTRIEPKFTIDTEHKSDLQLHNSPECKLQFTDEIGTNKLYSRSCTFSEERSSKVNLLALFGTHGDKFLPQR